MEKVFIATTSFAKDDNSPLEMLREAGLEISVNTYGRKLTEDEAIECLRDVDFLIAGTEPLTRRVLESAKKLKIISRCGAGMDNVDLQAAGQLNLEVYNTPYGPTLAVAELTIGLVIDLMRKISLMDREVRSGVWKKRTGNLLNGKKAGIIGLGRIGKKVAELLITFGVDIAYSDPNPGTGTLPFAQKQIHDLLPWADVITIHCSMTADGKPIIGKEEIGLMKKGSWLVNVSRGGLIDEDALYLSLKHGHLAGAALDVFDKEPYNGPLKDLDNVVITPHIGSYAKESRIEMEIETVRNLLNGMKS